MILHTEVVNSCRLFFSGFELTNVSFLNQCARETNRWKYQQKLLLRTAIFGLVLLAPCVSRVEAQTNTFPLDGNVGIGTTTPIVKVQTVVNSANTDNVNVQAADIGLAVGNSNSTANNLSVISFLNSWPAGQAQIGVVNLGTTAVSGGHLFFNTRAAGGGIAERMRITSAGYLGIGTTAPTQNLDVAGNIVATGSQTSTTANKGVIEVTNTITNNATASAAIRARNTFNGSGTFAAGLDVVPTFAPTASVSLARGGVIGGIFAPPSGITINDVFGLNAVTAYQDSPGAVTAGSTLVASTPIVSGALKPTTQIGLNVHNQGISGTTNSYGIYVKSQLGSTNNYAAVFEGGNFGIGTTNPIDAFELEKNQNGNTIAQIKNGTAGSLAQAGVRMVNDTGKVAQFGIYSSLRVPFGSLAANEAYAFASTNLMLMANSADAVIKFATGGSSEKMRIDASGRVGIGTTTPAAAYKLDVAGAINATAVNVNGTPVVSSQWTPNGTDIGYAAGRVGIGTTTPAPAYKLDVAGAINATAVNVNGTPVVSSQWTPNGTDIGYAAGRVGIGTTAPAAAYKLDVAGAINATAVNVNGTPVVSSQWTSSGNDISYVTGNVGIGTAGSPKNLHVAGNVTVDGNINAKYQDVAEWVPSTRALPAGTVVTLDPTKSNHVEASSKAYDTRVAGVVSAQPGIALGEQGNNKVLVATTGRVKVMVDASAGPIGVGDLLVTSDIAGVAMKSEPVQVGKRSMHMPGTLIGKAVEPLAKGRGEVLVLLSLQ